VSDDVRADLKEFLDGLRARDSILDYEIVTHPDGSLTLTVTQHPVLKTITISDDKYRKVLDDLVRELDELESRS
jgi:hypothetical protein